MPDIHIPPEAMKAAENAYCEAWDRDEPALLAAIRAALEAWPGAGNAAIPHWPGPHQEIEQRPSIILPLTEPRE